MSHTLTQDADLIYQCIGGEQDTTPPTFEHGVPSFTQVIINDKVAKLPPKRFTEAIRFLVRMEMVHLIQTGECSCGSPRYDVVPVDSRVPYDVHEVITRIVDGGERVRRLPRWDLCVRGGATAPIFEDGWWHTSFRSG